MDSLEKISVDTIRGALPDVKLIYLFGSGAGNESHRQSDVDLALRCPRELLSLVRWELQEKLASLLHTDVDLVDLHAASTVMRMQVVSTGRILYHQNSSTRDHFETYVYSEYALLNEERRGILHDIQERGSVYGS